VKKLVSGAAQRVFWPRRNVPSTAIGAISILMQMAVYAGFPAALNGQFAAQEVFQERDAAQSEV
jgi:4-carboxymuconolactone decarboxylase